PVTGIEKKGNNLYACTLGNGVYVYNQNISNWIPFNNSLPSYSVNVNCLLSTSSALFNAAGANGTFYRYNFSINAWNEEYYYDMLEFQTKLFLARADGLYFKGILSGVEDINDNNNSSVNIYPNPSTASAINISSNMQVNTFAVITAVGQIAYSGKVGKSEFTI